MSRARWLYRDAFVKCRACMQWFKVGDLPVRSENIIGVRGVRRIRGCPGCGGDLLRVDAHPRRAAIRRMRK